MTGVLIEVFIFIPWGGQIRFRVYVEDGKFTYHPSDQIYDSKIVVMSGRSIVRSTTTKELQNFEDRKDMKKAEILARFEHIVKHMGAQIKGVGSMYVNTQSIGDCAVNFYIFPISVY